MENNNTVGSTLSGMMAVKHPTLGVLVREDGMVFNKIPGGNQMPENDRRRHEQSNH